MYNYIDVSKFNSSTFSYFQTDDMVLFIAVPRALSCLGQVQDLDKSFVNSGALTELYQKNSIYRPR